MGREVRRVPLDFDWPLRKIWEGFLMPDRFDGTKCPDCTRGYSPRAERLYDQWYGNALFDPASTGSTPWLPDSPPVRAHAERNIRSAPDFYGTGEDATVREAQRLAALFNRRWMHHLSQDDVDALLTNDRLYDFTHTWSRESGWQPKDPPVVPTAAQVNAWSLTSLDHDGINASTVINARCTREGIDSTCRTCDGHASLEAYPGQRAEAEAWKPTPPPTGDGWQLWETTTEGSPISPVARTAEDLARWISSPANTRPMDRAPYETALAFVRDGWAPTFVAVRGVGVVSGIQAATPAKEPSEEV